MRHLPPNLAGYHSSFYPGHGELEWLRCCRSGSSSTSSRLIANLPVQRLWIPTVENNQHKKILFLGITIPICNNSSRCGDHLASGSHWISAWQHHNEHNHAIRFKIELKKVWFCSACALPIGSAPQNIHYCDALSPKFVHIANSSNQISTPRKINALDNSSNLSFPIGLIKIEEPFTALDISWFSFWLAKVQCMIWYVSPNPPQSQEKKTLKKFGGD